MHLINQTHSQVLTNHEHTASDPNFPAFGRVFGLLQGGFGAVGDEVERRTALHGQWSARMMRQYKNGCVIRRRVSPPALPGIIFPGAANWTEHVSAQNPGTDILEGFGGKVIVDAEGTAGLVMNFTKDLGLYGPGMQLQPANAKWIF